MRSRPLAFLLIAAVAASPVAASPKPCRDAQGRVIPSAKPATPKPHRCKDAGGRFVACEHAPAAPK